MNATRALVWTAWLILFVPMMADAKGAADPKDVLKEVVSTKDVFKKSQLVHTQS